MKVNMKEVLAAQDGMHRVQWSEGSYLPHCTYNSSIILHPVVYILPPEFQQAVVPFSWINYLLASY